MCPKVSEDYKAQRRQQLLKQALMCFGDKGFEATTIDDIASFAGVSKGMLYTYFQSKEEIFLSILRQHTEEQVAQLEQEIYQLHSPMEKLLLVIRRYKNSPFGDDQKKWTRVYIEFWLHAANHPIRQQYLTERFATLMQLLQEIVELGQATGDFRNDVNAHSVAALYWALCDGLHLHFLQIGGAAEHSELWDDAENLVIQYVMPPSASSS